MTTEEITLKYFEAFNDHDLQSLSELYSDNVVLNEWNENIFTGKEAVLEANKTLFSNEPNIELDYNAPWVTEKYGTSYMHIVVSRLKSGKPIEVIDMLEIEDGKIVLIKAFRCF